MSLKMDRNSKAKWKADIDGSKPGADFFLTRTPAEYNLEAYFKYRGATSSRREDLTYELSEWVKFFSASGKQILRDVARSFRCQWKSMSKFWDEIEERESQQRQFEQLMEQRKIDLRRQNVHQFRIDGNAMTRELDEALGGMSEPNQKLNRPKRPSVEVAPELESASVPDQERPTKRVAFRDDVFASECGSDYVDSNPSLVRSSLNSIDFKYIDHLVGPGTTSSRLNTSSRLIVGEIDVSEVLMNARRDNLKKQSEIADVSDLLTINFIFDANFLRKHLLTATAESLLNVIVPKPTTSEIALFMDFSIFAATHSYQEAKRDLRKRIQEKEDCIVTAVLLSYTERPGLWKQVSSHPASLSSLSQNEDTYTQSIVKNIIFGIVGDLDVVDHWSRDPLPTPHGFEELYFPDYFAEFDNLPLFVVEIKKPGAMDDDLEGDQRKLPCMMKLILDTILDAGVLAPSVIGLLIRVI
ncbi:hypothetical protein BGZ95_005292 [Linnemannia exigua]|uniref:Uncharacterized protein n=1 Tax=Linnemannia exigua TaxID=604196 RepID=A0AAD4D247_9FUNG|nr:hypothetical protein BGZ95_005292 [Linnemannia exigua]